MSLKYEPSSGYGSSPNLDPAPLRVPRVFQAFVSFRLIDFCITSAGYGSSAKLDPAPMLVPRVAPNDEYMYNRYIIWLIYVSCWYASLFDVYARRLWSEP